MISTLVPAKPLKAVKCVRASTRAGAPDRAPEGVCCALCMVVIKNVVSA